MGRHRRRIASIVAVWVLCLAAGHVAYVSYLADQPGSAVRILPAKGCWIGRRTHYIMGPLHTHSWRTTRGCGWYEVYEDSDLIRDKG